MLNYRTFRAFARHCAVGLTAALAFSANVTAQSVTARGERSILRPFAPEALLRFGTSVATDGGMSAVGAPGYNLNTGAVDIFTRGSSDSWQFTMRLLGSQGSAEDLFGASVALQGDTVIVGAPGAGGPLSTSQGVVYVFKKVGSAWVESAILSASDGDDNDMFGASVAFKGDTLVVGAPEADVGGFVDRGAAYVFRTNGNGWAQEGKLTASNGAASHKFGTSVAYYQFPLSGKAVLVGAPSYNLGGGAAYMFRKPATTWTQVSQLSPSGQAGASRFGQSVALGVVYGTETAVVGAPDATSSGVATGVAFVHYKSIINSAEFWNSSAQLKQADGAAGYRFGEALAMQDDRVVVGAPNDDRGGGLKEGSATVFRHSSYGWHRGAKLSWSHSAGGGPYLGNPSTGFGCAIALAGERVVIGASFAFLEPAGGAAYNFKLDYLHSSIDDNGRDDVVWFNPSTGTLSGWSMDDATRVALASGTYAGVLGTNYEYCSTGDLYGDGRTCMVYREKGTGVFRARRASGTTVVSDLPISGGVPSEWRFLALTDISGDGKADVVLLNALTMGVNAWLMDGHTKMDGGAISTAAGLRFVGAGDLNSDGRSDLLWQDTAGVVHAWMMNGRTIASSGPISGVGAVATQWRVVAMGDLDGDGDRDIVWRNLLTGGVSGWRMQGLVRQQGVVIATTVALNWRIEAAVDLDGDGTDDLLWRNMTNGDVSRWRIVDFFKASGLFIRNAALSWSVLSDDDYNDDRGWDGNGDDDNGDDNNGDDWNDDHGGTDADDNSSGGNETVSKAAFNGAINAALAASNLPILEAEAELESGVEYVSVYQWQTVGTEVPLMNLVVVRVSTQTVVYTASWYPTADDLDRYGDAIDMLGDVTVSPVAAVNAATAVYPFSEVHSVELSAEDFGPVWDVELVLSNGTFVQYSVNAY